MYICIPTQHREDSSGDRKLSSRTWHPFRPPVHPRSSVSGGGGGLFRCGIDCLTAGRPDGSRLTDWFEQTQTHVVVLSLRYRGRSRWNSGCCCCCFPESSGILDHRRRTILLTNSRLNDDGIQYTFSCVLILSWTTRSSLPQLFLNILSILYKVIRTRLSTTKLRWGFPIAPPWST